MSFLMRRIVSNKNGELVESRESKKEAINAVESKKPRKSEYLISLIVIFLVFFINEFYKVGFRWDSMAVAQTVGFIMPSFFISWLFLVYFNRKLFKNMFWSFFAVMVLAGLGGVGQEAYHLSREIGATVDEANKAMFVSMAVLLIPSSFLYGVLSIIYRCFRKSNKN